MFNSDNSFVMNAEYHAHPKNVLTTITPYCVEVMKHPRNYIEYKEKRVKAVDAACIHYGKAYDIISLINPLSCSYLLGRCDLIVNPFVDECAKILACVEFFESETLAIAKSCQEVNEWYKPIFKLLDKKQVVSSMLDDLTFWSDSCDFTYDKSEVIQLFNQIKQAHIKTLIGIYKGKK